jgi:uncharacterized membrane protein YGL010W
MRSAEQWFDLYGHSHQNKLNKLIHWVCIPTITLVTLGLLQSIPHPFGDQPFVHWGTLFGVLAVVFYARLSLTLAVGMGMVGAACLGVNAAIAQSDVSLLWFSVVVFVIAWAAQFIGHKIEGEKPSFFQDVQFLLVGPAWLLQFVYARVGIPLHLGASTKSAA